MEELIAETALLIANEAEKKIAHPTVQDLRAVREAAEIVLAKVLPQLIRPVNADSP